jgi:hypothetical protein
MLPDERAKLSRSNAATISRLFDSEDIDELMAIAYAGRAKRDWYEQATKAILEIFGADDAPRFTALLAAMSPRTTVEANAFNAVSTWANWVRANRPQDAEAIKRIIGESVRGERGIDSALPAWIPNSVAALSHPDPASLKLSGPKVDSIFANLRGDGNEVTLDTWMATLFNQPQKLFQKSGKNPGKGPGYIAYAAVVRATAARMTQMLGETWTPAQTQTAAWVVIKALGGKVPREGRSALDIVKSGGLTGEDIRATPDFALLFTQGAHRSILERAGYGKQLDALRRRLASDRRGDGGDRARHGDGDRPSGSTAGWSGSRDRIHNCHSWPTVTATDRAAPCSFDKAAITLVRRNSVVSAGASVTTPWSNFCFRTAR